MRTAVGKLNGSKNYTTMKKYIKIYALLAMALFVGACEDELGNSFEPVQIVSGEEIIFGASYRSASADKAPADRTTRTDYGETNDERTWIEINWAAGDRMQIASPQSAGVAKGVAEYKVQASQDSEDDGGASKVTELVRTGDAGLQWGNIAQDYVYDFYAVYPSVNQLKESPVAAAANGCSLTEDGFLTGYLPTDQTSTKVLGNNNRYVFLPNMDYAYMVAKTDYTIKFDDEGVAFMDDQINLEFESLVTALQFQIKAGTLDIPNTQTNHIEIISVAVFSQSGLQLAGDFEYDIKADGTKGLVSKGKNAYSQVIQKFNGFGTPVILNNYPSSALDLTFFLLPSIENYPIGDLKLQVVYVVDGVTQIKTATIGTDIPARVKRYFKDVVLPSHTKEVDASVWFQALNPNILVSQVSIPVAANTFANSEYGLKDTYRTQQTLPIEDMWDLGVRGFEMVNTSFGYDKTTENLEGKNMVASESTEYSTGKFCENLKKLYEKQKKTFVYKKDANGNNTAELESGDPIILICTYGATNDGYNPRCYVANLFNSLSKFCSDNKVDPSTFVQLSANSTVKDVMGKICVIIRPGDDERWAYEENTYTDPYNRVYKESTIDTTKISKYGLTYSLPKVVDSEWWTRVLLISDWGMDSWDSWHRRFGEDGFYKYATTATNYENLGDRKVIKNQQMYEQYIVNGGAPKTGKYYYSHDLSNGKTAYVQDMVRVVDVAYNGNVKVFNNSSSSSNKSVNWFESLDEKKRAIDGLFILSVATNNDNPSNDDPSNDDISNDDIYINNLSGYFPTLAYEYTTGSYRKNGGQVSYFPVYDSKGFRNSGKGGNYKGCADALTDYVYGILSGGTMASGGQLAEGPWGLVMMDYVGSATKSKELVNLIMMNNFAGFDLAEKQDQNNDPQLVKVTLNGEKVNPEAEVFVTWN
jgi:hypothetical protein